MRQIIYIFLVSLLLLFTACAQRVRIDALEPAQVDRISETKKIAVLNFKNDYVGLSRKIEANLAGFRINNKKYFTIVSRNDFNTILKEQRLQNSGLVDEASSVKVGELIGAQAIISGDVRRPTKEDNYFYESRVRCANSKCSELTYYNVRCMKRVVGLSAEIRVVDVSKGDIIFADTLSRNAVFKHCSDDGRVIPSTSMAAQRLANSIANEFTYKLTPHYRSFSVELLDDPDLDYTSGEKKLLKYALEYIEQGRYDKAEELLERLIDATDQKSYVAFYDLGVVKEAQGKYDDAKEYYDYADHLMVEPVEEINRAVVRINALISKRKKTMEQLTR
jgi:hypothetical protein